MMRAPAFWEHGGPAARLLAPAAAAVAAAAAVRGRWARPAPAGVPVLCVGNLVAGGAGKTPVALALLERLAAGGFAVHAVARGYGGRLAGPQRVDAHRHTAREVGDEALLLARAAPTWVARDRAAAARAAAASGASVVVLDDGLQSPALATDLALLVLDGDYGLGNGRVLPAGPLREPPARGLARADAVVVMGEDRCGAAELAAGRPLLCARLAPAPGARELAGRRVLAFAGIARPRKLAETLTELGAEVAALRAFADHHRYRAGEVERLLAEARALQALPVTTEKDAVRLPAAARGEVAVLPVRVAWQEPAALERLLQPIVAHAAAPA